MTQTAWAHLPNAKHIDWVIASLKVHPEKWPAANNAAYNAAKNAAWHAARIAAWAAAWKAASDAAYDAAWTAAIDAARSAARDAGWDAAWYAASDAILALIAYDDCAYMIESEIGELKIIAAFGDQRAILLLPACIVLYSMKQRN